MHTCSYTSVRVSPLLNQHSPQPSQTACPLHPSSTHATSPDGQLASAAVTALCSPAIQGVVDFARAIPGFNMLTHDDRVTLLKVCVCVVTNIPTSAL
jgi:hypothetical protein